MTVKTAEIFFFWVAGTWSHPMTAQMYALPLSSKVLKDHPLMKCLRTAKIIIVDEKTRLPKKPIFEFCTILVHQNPAGRRSGKIPIATSGFCSNVVARKLRRDPRVHRLLNFRNKSISKIDGKAVRIISKLLTPGKHLYRVTAKDDCRDDVKDTLLNFSIDRKCFPLCKVILETKVNVNEEVYGTYLGHHSALTRAIRTGSIKMIQLLLDHGADDTKGSILCTAAESGHLSVIKFFLERGKRVKERDSETGNTALHEVWDPEHAKLLLASGGDVNDTNKMLETPLHAAVKDANHEVVRVLLDHNANINALFRTEFEDFDVIHDTDKWPSPYSNAVAAAACLYASTIFEMLIMYGATANFEDVLRIPSRQTDMSKENLSDKLERFFDFTFADFNDADHSLVQNRIQWYLDTIGDLDLEQDFLTGEEYGSLKEIADKITVQIVKVEAVYNSLGPEIPKELFNELKLDEYKERCKNEVELLKRKNVPGTSVPLYDILIGDPSFVSRFFRDRSVAAALNKEALYADFPIYGGVLRSRVSRGSWRRQILNDGIKICTALFSQFVSLPWSVRESIVNLLTNQEILVVEACFSRKQLRAIVGIPNCQTLLDKL